MGRHYEPWHHQPLAQGDVDISASSCYQVCNGGAIGRPLCSQIDVHSPTGLDVVAVALYSEGPDSCALLGALAQDVTLWRSGAE